MLYKNCFKCRNLVSTVDVVFYTKAANASANAKKALLILDAIEFNSSLKMLEGNNGSSQAVIELDKKHANRYLNPCVLGKKFIKVRYNSENPYNANQYCVTSFTTKV